jgi:hypothetical protein
MMIGTIIGPIDAFQIIIPAIFFLGLVFMLLKYLVHRVAEKRWPTAIGTITSKNVGVFQGRKGRRGCVATFRYSISVNADAWSGKFCSRSVWRSSCEKDVSMIEIGRPVVVRYNPAQPDETAVLAVDNPDLPFKPDF